MNKLDVYKNVDTILNINNEVEQPKKQVEPKIINPYKKGQRLYERHFFEDIYKVNINNEVKQSKKPVEHKIIYPIYPYKKGQKLYEKHFFEDIYKVNNINTHTGIIVLEIYEKYIKLIGDYLIDLTIKEDLKTV